MRISVILAGIVGLAIVTVCVMVWRSRPDGELGAPPSPSAHAPFDPIEVGSVGSSDSPQRVEIPGLSDGAAISPVKRAVLMDPHGVPLAGMRLSTSPAESNDLTLRDGVLRESANGTVHSVVVTHDLRDALERDPASADDVLREFQDKSRALELILGTRPEGAAAAVLTEEDGSFPCPASHGVVTLARDDHVVVATGSMRRNDRVERVFIAARSVRVAGRVENEVGLPLENVLVSPSRLEPFHIRSFPYLVEEVRMFADVRPLVLRAARTNSSGSFDLGRVPALEGLQVLTTKTDHRAAPVDLPMTDEVELTIVMTKTEPRARPRRIAAAGIVLDHRGAPAAGARVLLGNDRTASDPAGRFTIRWHADSAGAASLVAFQEGFQPAVVTEFGERLRTEGELIDVILVLGPETVMLAGSVLDAQGEPRAGVDVYVMNPIRPDSCGSPSGIEIEETRTRTDESGSFRLTNLSERDYVLRLVEPSTAVSIEAGPFRAGGDEVRIQFPATGNARTVRGQVRSEAGHPIAGVTVTAVTVISGDAYCRELVTGKTTLTADDGTFELEGCSRSGGWLSFQGGSVEGALIELEAQGLTQPLVVTLAAYHRFLVRLGEIHVGTADRLSFRDASDLEVPFLPTTRSGVGASFMKISFEDLLEEPIRVSERAKDLILLEGDREVRRIRLPECKPGETRTVP